MAYLSVRNLVKSYGEARILDGFSLEARKGEFVSLLGPSGSGKTTILRCIAGLERPDRQSGEINLRARRLSGPDEFVEPEKRRLGMVFQNYAVWPHLTVFENVAFPLRLNRGATGDGEIAAKVSEALKLVRLEGFDQRYPAQLSGGQQQRVALARALAMAPDLLLLDEPLSNLDALLREELGADIRRLQRSLDLTTILVTHDQREALSLSDRIIVLRDGKIEASGAPEDLYRDPPTEFSAQFLAGGQAVRLAGAASKLLLPRRWKATRGSGVRADGLHGEVTARIFLGSEYEYRARCNGCEEEVRFFSLERFEPGVTVALRYDETELQ